MLLSGYSFSGPGNQCKFSYTEFKQIMKNELRNAADGSVDCSNIPKGLTC